MILSVCNSRGDTTDGRNQISPRPASVGFLRVSHSKAVLAGKAMPAAGSPSKKKLLSRSNHNTLPGGAPNPACQEEIFFE